MERPAPPKGREVPTVAAGGWLDAEYILFAWDRVFERPDAWLPLPMLDIIEINLLPLLPTCIKEDK